jgi:muconate cycloisomerase
MSFRITSLQTCITPHRLREDRVIVSPAGRHDVSRYLTVCVRDSDGMPGYGEAATTALWSGETAETAQYFVDHIFAPLILGATFDHPREVLALMDKTVWGHPFTKSAVDTAVWDVWAKSRNVAATALFGDRAPLESIPTRASIGCYDVQETVRIACEFWRLGVQTLKFKIGVPDFDDVERLRAVREAIGDEPVFTVDANGAYTTLESAVSAIEALAPYSLALVEQPVPRERKALLAAVRARVSTPVLADEAIFTIQDLREMLDLDACDFVSLYPGKNGGVTHCIEMAGLAASAGKACALGSNLETDLGQAAMLGVAAALTAFPVESLPCDLGASLFYEASSIKNPLALQCGRVLLPSGAGFGVEPCNGAL